MCCFSERQDTLSEAIYSIVMQLVEDVSSLPAPLVVFLRTANVALSTRSMHAPHDCVGIKVRAQCSAATYQTG